MFKTFKILFGTVWFLINIRGSSGIDWNVHLPKTCLNDLNYSREEGDKTVAFVGIKVCDVYDISENEMEFGLQIILYEVWKDRQLVFEPGEIITSSVIPEPVVNCIWKPDLIFGNSKDGKLYDITVPNVFYKIIPEGFVYKISRYHLVVSCTMSFLYYPMDTQNCFLLINFMSSTEDQVSLSWLGDPGTPILFSKRKGVSMSDHIKALQFVISSPVQHTSRIKRTTGTYTELYANFTFNRRLTSSIVNSYIPSLLVMCVSWVSFWLDVNAVPGRVTLGVTALLTLSTQIAHARSALPPLDYMTALDVWLFGCLVMVFLSLVEFTLANIHSRKMAAKNSPPKTYHNEVWKCGIGIPRKVSAPACLVKNTSCAPTSSTKAQLPAPGFYDRLPEGTDANIFDKCARVVFPTLLVFFSSIYWSFYLTRK